MKRLIGRVNKSTRKAQAILKEMATENKQFKKQRKKAKAKARDEGREFVDEHAHVLRYVAVAVAAVVVWRPPPAPTQCVWCV